jgi:hypothetical protein
VVCIILNSRKDETTWALLTLRVMGLVPSSIFSKHVFLRNLWHFVSILMTVRCHQRATPLGRRSVKTQLYNRISQSLVITHFSEFSKNTAMLVWATITHNNLLLFIAWPSNGVSAYSCEWLHTKYDS